MLSCFYYGVFNSEQKVEFDLICFANNSESFKYKHPNKRKKTLILVGDLLNLNHDRYLK